jgi:hypothetical protein
MSKISDEQLRHFARLFFNRDDCFYQQQDDGSWRFRKQRLMLNHIWQHINGDITLGAPTISQDGFCRYVVWDSDYAFGSLNVLQAFLNKIGFTTYRESISLKRAREGHLWLWIDAPIESAVAHDFVRVVTAAAGLVLDQGSKIPGSLEAWPKQAATKNASSNIRVPVGINRRSGERGWFEHLSQNIEQQLAFVPIFNSREQIYIHTELRGKLLEAIKPKPKAIYKNDNGILNIIPAWWMVDARQYGNKLILRCPSCRASQHDQKHGSMHLCVYSDGRFGCIKGCSGRNIWQAFKRLMNVRDVA